jgi:hypothetical protein
LPIFPAGIPNRDTSRKLVRQTVLVADLDRFVQPHGAKRKGAALAGLPLSLFVRAAALKEARRLIKQG